MRSFDPFAALSVARRCLIDAQAVRRAYLRAAAELHPDVAGDDPETVDRSAAINQAKAILEDPEKRALALWQLLAEEFQLPAHEAGKPVDDRRALPPGFLMEMMEIREELEPVIASQDPAKIAHWEEWGVGQRRDYEQRVSRRLDELASAGEASKSAQGIPPADAPARLNAIKLDLNAWRYIERLLEQLRSPQGL